jgi:hypothetical protein
LRTRRFEPRERRDRRAAARATLTAAVARGGRAGHQNDVAQAGAGGERLAHALIGRRVLHEEDGRARVFHDVAALLRRERRVDGHVHRPGEEAGGVRHHPLGRAFGEEGDAVAASHPERVEAEGNPARAPFELLRRDGAPGALPLVAQGVGARVARERPLDDLDERRRLVGRRRHALRTHPRVRAGGGRHLSRHGFTHRALTPSKKMLRTSPAIGASL